MSYDRATGDMVLFGGFDATNYLNDTWTFSGTTWTNLSTATSPPVRYAASMAFDPATGDMILFGGQNANQNFDDTWSFNGSTWTQLSPVTSPPPNEFASMAFDPATGNLVLFGGYGLNGLYSNDTWTFNGSTWTQLSPAASPPARDQASMAFDPAIGRMVLIGGGSDSSPFLNDTWTFNGSSWTELSAATSPPAAYDASMAYDPATGNMELFADYGPTGYVEGTWTFNGLTWTQLSPAASPPDLLATSMDFDPATGNIVLFGGYGPSGASNATWTWGYPNHPATSWIQLSPSVSPPARYGAATAFDPAIGKVILFGGWGGGSNLDMKDTWTFDGSTWTRLDPSTNPPGRQFASMVFDPATGNIVLFGGYTLFGALNDTWTFNGTTWKQLSPETSPSARYGASTSFDPATGNIVLFGGFVDNDVGPSDDTWTFNGTTWTQLSPAASPPARGYTPMAFDPATGNVMLFGGYGNNNGTDVFGDTWEFDGISWTQLSPATSPPAREGSSMTYDPAAGSMVLSGGFGNAGLLDDTWSFAGSTWTQLAPTENAPRQMFAATAFDPSTGTIVTFGGNDNSNGVFDDTWLYGLQGDTVPGAPTDVTSIPGNDRLTVSWVPPTNDGGTAITNFKASISSGKFSTSCVTILHSCSFTKLVSTVPLSVKVTATNAVGTGPAASLPYEVYPVTALKLSVRVIPIVVQTKVSFVVLAYGATPGRKVIFGVPGSAPTCTIDAAYQCWASAKVNRTGKWTALATTSKATASRVFFAPSVKVPLQVKHGKTMVISISAAPPGCAILETVAGKSYSTKASRTGTAILKVKVVSVGVLKVMVTIDGTIFKPYLVDVT